MSWLQERLHFFRITRNCKRWNLQDPEDAFKLWYEIRMLAVAHFDLYMLQNRAHQYAKAHTSFGQYRALSKIESMIFPWIGSTSTDFSDVYNRVKRQIKELEDGLNEVS